MSLKKFENVDVVDTLRSIMKQNTVYYQSDFQYDAEMFQTAATSTERGQKTFLWLSRPCGTFCERERDALLLETAQYYEWTYYEGTKDRILALAVEITGMERKKIRGNLYQLDYAAHVEHLKKIALPIHHVTLTFADGSRCTCTPEEYSGHRHAIEYRYGEIKQARMEPTNAEELAGLLWEEQDGRKRPPPGKATFQPIADLLLL